MNDRAPAVAKLQGKLFSVKPNEAVIETASFGAVTLRAISVAEYREMESHNEDNAERFAYELLSAMATGPGGERFTPDLFATLPVHVLADVGVLSTAARRLNWPAPPDVKKD